jgi:cell wall-associated NlpC family hydrolase
MTGANPYQSMQIDGDRIIISRGARAPEIHQFATAAEAVARAAIIDQAFSWVGTPFINCADIKGAQGGIDCAMLATRCYVDSGRLPPFDPRPYPPAWMMHHSEERFLGWIQDRLGAREVDAPRLGDVPVWQFGRCFSHCGVVVNAIEVVHAFRHAGMAIVSRLDEHSLRFIRGGIPRPVKYFDVWSA